MTGRIVSSAVTCGLLVSLCTCSLAQDVETLRLAAEQGDAEAQYSFALMYRNGEGVPQDDAEPARWLRLAADQGHAGAQYSLGAMYATGRGVVQDYVQAHMWRNLAASRQTGEDRELSVEARDALADLMTPKISAKPNASPPNGTNAPACVNRRYF